MLISKKVEVKWHYTNKDYYESIKNEDGQQKYIFNGYNNTFIVDVKDLMPNATVEIEFICDYCGNKGKKPYHNYRKVLEKSVIKKDACEKCRNLKRKETTLLLYGVENVMQLDEVKEKLYKTNEEKYGVKNVNKLDSIKNKIKNTIKNKYGVEYYFQTEEFKEKYKKKMNEKYGVDNAFQAEEVKEKIKDYYKKNYGVEYYSQTQDYREKFKKVNLEKYGVDNYAKSEEFKQKYQNVMKKKYGVEHYSKTNEFKEKFKSTSLEKYGVEHPAMLPDVIEKGKMTTLKKYGVEHYSKTQEFLEKVKNTNLEKYGVEFSMQNPDVASKARKTMYLRGTAPTSIQQIYYNKIIKGELNYPFKNISIDIALPFEQIAIEYDGGGHDLQVKYGNMTEEEFIQKELRRNYFLKRNGWKLIKIVSNTDKVPEKKYVLKMLEFAKNLFSQGRSWVYFYLDEGLVEYRNHKEKFDYGKLKYLKKTKREVI